jgi:site-specific DNA-methyltransferase (adenine-specific)
MKPNYVSMIFPSRWFTGGRGLDDFRNKMLNDERIRLIKDFVDSTDLFPTADISGGINYILWDKNYHGLCDFTGIHKGKTTRMMRKLNQFETFVRRNDALSIIEKIVSRKEHTMSETVSGQTPFGFITTFKGETNPFSDSLSLYGSNGNITYVSRDQVDKNQSMIDKYKVVFTKAAPGGGSSDRNGMYLLISSLQILKPMEICTQTFLVGNSLSTYEEALNCMNYIKCKFTRFLILQSMTSQDLSPERFRFVPLQDFSKPWTDAELYEKYRLTDEEIAFIESMIKPME